MEVRSKPLLQWENVMDMREIEAWADRVMEAVKRGEPFEHTYVELKAQWPSDHSKAAERIG